MKKVIIFHDPDTDQLALCWPAQKCALTDHETALKDVPTGVKFKIVNESDLPPDLEFIDAWEYDFSDVTDVGA